MYYIIQDPDGQWFSFVSIQDGTEKSGPFGSKEKAVRATIRAAEVWNHVYILPSDVAVHAYKEPIRRVVDQSVIDQITRGDMVLLPREDKRVKYNIQDAECDLVLAIRKGLVLVVEVKD